MIMNLLRALNCWVLSIYIHHRKHLKKIMLKYLRHISRKPACKAKQKIGIYNLHNGWHDKHAEGKINQQASVAHTR
jgi:hypothetical protein